MRDDSKPSISPYEDPDDLSPVEDEAGSWMRDRLEQEFGGRPLILYLLVAAGMAVLVLLAIIIWVSARGDGRGSQSICLDISATDAVNQVLAGHVDGVVVIIDRDRAELGPAAIQLEMSDGSCRVAPQGVDNRDAMLQVLGAIEFTNTIGERRIRAEYRRENVPEELLSTATPTPEPTQAAEETPTPDPSATVLSETPTPTATPPPDEASPTP